MRAANGARPPRGSGAGGRARRLVGARVTDEHEWPVGAVVCVHDRKMDEPWCLVASEGTVPTRGLIRYYGKRWGIEAGFRDIKDMRFGMGLSSMHVSRPDRRDRLLLISALAIAVLSLLGAAGERIGYDRWLKAVEGEHGEAADALVVSARVDAVPPSSQLARGSDSSADGDVREHADRTAGVPRGLRRDLMPCEMRGCMSSRTAVRREQPRTTPRRGSVRSPPTDQRSTDSASSTGSMLRSEATSSCNRGAPDSAQSYSESAILARASSRTSSWVIGLRGWWLRHIGLRTR